MLRQEDDEGRGADVRLTGKSLILQKKPVACWMRSVLQAIVANAGSSPVWFFLVLIWKGRLGEILEEFRV